MREDSVRNGGSTPAAAAWMVGLSLLLFWLPVVGPFIAGFVGGRKAATMGRATIAAFAPAVLLGIVVVAILAAFDLPVIGAVAGIGVVIAVVVQDVPLFIGAWMGAAATEPVAN